MRKLTIIGLLGIFMASAYVPPNHDGFLAIAQKIGQEVTQSTGGIRISLGSDPLSPDNLTMAARTLDALSKKASSLAPTIKTLQTPESVSKFKQAASLLSSLGVQAGKVIQVANHTAPIQNGTKWKTALRTETDGTIRSQLDLIETARTTGDIRLCQNLQGSQLTERIVNDVSVPVASRSDFVAYCNARVTRGAERCAQIADNTSPPLRELCVDELSSAF